MRHWIADVALKELSAAHDCFDLNLQPTDDLETRRYSFTEDRVTVHLTERRRVQIIDVKTLTFGNIIKY